MYHKYISFLKSFNKFMHYIYIFLFIYIIYSTSCYTTYSHLAFNINIIYSKQNKNHKIIHYVYLKGVNTFFFKYKILNQLTFKLRHSRYLQIAEFLVQNNILYLKKSGFLNSYHSSLIIRNNIKHFIVTLKMNPILRKVNIKSIQDLYIPKNFIQRIFYNQIGLPKNFIHINKSLETIKSWYVSRGFKWSAIQLIKTPLVNDIYIAIYEGKIKEVKISCVIENNIETALYNELNLLIKKELQLLQGQILNIQQIESGIINLKQSKIIANCNYRIVPHHREGFIIIFKYNIYRNKIAYLFGKNSISANSSKNNFISLTSRFFCFPVQYRSYIIWPSSLYLGFKYKLHNLTHYKNHLFSDIQIFKNYLQIDALYLLPYIKIYKYLSGHMWLNIYKRFYSLQDIIYMSANSINILAYSPLIIQLKSYGTKIFFNHFIFRKIFLADQLMINRNIYKKNYINMYLYNVSLSSNLFKQRKIYKKVKQNLINLHVHLKYQAYDFKNTMKSRKLFIVDLCQFLNISIKRYHRYYLLQHYGHNLYLKYQKIFAIPYIIKCIKHNTLIASSECNLYIGQKGYLPVLYETLTTNHKILSPLPMRTINMHYSFCLFYLEYQLPVYKYSALYTYIKYKMNIYPSIISSRYIHKFIWNNTCTQNNIYAMGVQLDIPIKRIPYIRIEYITNFQGKSFFQVKSSIK